MIPKALKEFLDEDGDRIKLRARDETSQPIGMLIIPEAKFKAVQTFLPAELSKITPQGRCRQSMRLFFIVPDLPANITMLRDEDTTAYFSGYRMSFPAGEWIDNPQAELPFVTYADVARLMGAPSHVEMNIPTEETTRDGCNIPQEMKNANQWLLWKFGERDGKKTKIPSSPAGKFTSAPDASWSYEECREVAARKGYGIGFSLKNGFVGIDYDHVLISDGSIKPEYAGLMEEIQALNSYTEVSPSGEGLHVFVRCEDIPPECKAGKHTERGEIYSTGRYFTVTGDAWKESPSRSINTISADVYRRVYTRIAGTPCKTPAQATIPAEPLIPQKFPTISNDEAFYRITKTEKGRALWNGDTSGYPSQSEADAALMNILADITECNEKRMRQLFLSSGLGKRDKAKRDDYLERTISGACKYVSKKKEQNIHIHHSEASKPQGGKEGCRTAIQACREMAGKLPDIRQAGDGIYIIIDPKDRLTKMVSSGQDDVFQRWCYHVFNESDEKFAEEVFRCISVLHSADPIPTIDIEKAITAIPCKGGGYISLKDGKRCERPAEMEYCPFVLNLTAEEAEYDPEYQPTGRAYGDLMTYLGRPALEYLLSLASASIPRIPANRMVTILTGPSRSSKTTLGKILGELGLAPPRNVDFSSEVDGKGKFRPELSTWIPQRPMVFINDPTDPDGNAVKKLCDTTQQYEAKYKNQSSTYQRASVILTMNHPPEFKTSAMENKVFFICSRQSYAGDEIPDDEYLEMIRVDGSLRDIWQAIIREGLRSEWKITIPEECKEHNQKMISGVAPLQKWLSACKPAPQEPKYFQPLWRIYENYMTAVNPDGDPNEIVTIVIKHKHAPKWEPTPKKDGIEGKSKMEVKSNLMALGFVDGRPENQQGFYIHLPDTSNGTPAPNPQYHPAEVVTTAEGWQQPSSQKMLS